MASWDMKITDTQSPDVNMKTLLFLSETGKITFGSIMYEKCVYLMYTSYPIVPIHTRKYSAPQT